MATMDDWILHSTGSFLTEEPVADASTYAPELQRQYTQITGITPYITGIQEFKKGGREKWNSYGLGSPLSDKNWFNRMGTADVLAKFGYTAPNVTHEQLVARDLAGEYGQYTQSVGANDATAKANAIFNIKKEWSNVRSSSSGSKAFLAKYGLNSAPYTHDLWNTDDQLAAAGGYSATTPQSQTDYFSGKYGSNFTDQQIEGALTGRYGEIEGAPDMGQGWQDLYDQYKTWGAEDDAWYDEMQQYQGIGEGMKSKTKAQMAAGGMAAGSQQWGRNLDRIDKMRIDLAGEREERREALKGTSVYEALDAEYKKNYRKDEQRVKGENITKYKDVLLKEGYMRPAYTDSVQRYDSQTGQVYFEDRQHDARWIDPIYGQEAYQEYQTTPTKTGRMLYGTGEDKSGTASFDDFYQQNFGNQDYTVPESDLLGEQTLKEETEDQRRARLSASGRNI